MVRYRVFHCLVSPRFAPACPGVPHVNVHAPFDTSTGPFVCTAGRPSAKYSFNWMHHEQYDQDAQVRKRYEDMIVSWRRCSGLIWRQNPRLMSTGHQFDAVLSLPHHSSVPATQACTNSRCVTLTRSRAAGRAGVRLCRALPRLSSGRADLWGGTWHRRWGRWACVWCCRIAAMKRTCSTFGRWETSVWSSCRRTLTCGTGTL